MHNLIVNSGGIFSVTATDVFGFVSSDIISVNKPIIAVNDTSFCINDSIILNPQLPPQYTLMWLPDSSTAPTLSVDSPGTYILNIYDSLGCDISKNIIVSADSFPVKASLGTLDSVCRNYEIGLEFGADVAVSYLWSDGGTDSLITIIASSGTQNISLTVTDNFGCSANINTIANILGTAPVASFTNNFYCFPQATWFADNSTSPDGSAINNFYWQFGDTNTQTLNISSPFTYSYNTSGIYNASLTVTTAVGCVKTTTQQVYVYSVPKPGFSPLLACTGTPITFHDASTNELGTIGTWFWNFGDPGSANNTSNDSMPVHVYNTDTTNTVTLIVTTQDGCTDSVKIPVSVRISPDVGFTYTDVCDGNPVYFNDTSHAEAWNQIFDWKWSINDVIIDNDVQNPVFSFDSAGVFEVILTVKSLNGCSASDTQNIVVHAIPVANFKSTDTCAQTPYTFTDSSTVQLPDYISNWLWNFGSLGTSSDTNPIITFPASGVYPVSLIITSNGGCKDSISYNLTVFPVPSAAFFPDEFYGIAPFTTSFINNSQGALYYLWNFGDEQTSSEQIPTHTYNNNGVYTVTLTVLNEYGCSDTENQQLMVIPTVADIAVTSMQAVKQDNYISISADITNFGTRKVNKIDLSARASSGSAFVETWNDYINTLDPGETMNYQFNAKYEISDNQITDYICVEAQIVNKNPDDNPSNNEQCFSFNKQFLVFNPYPSPTNDFVNFDFILPFSDDVQVDLYGIKGELVQNIFSGKGDKGLNKIKTDVSSLNLGVYVFRIKFRDDIKFMNFVKY